MSDQEQTSGGLSRRSLIKKAGIGAGVVWTAPILMSINSPASAASPTPCDCNTNYYADTCAQPFALVECNGVTTDVCFCGRTIDGQCTCIQRVACTIPPGAPGCTSNADCVALGFPASYLCIETCCDSVGQGPVFQCLPPCP